MELFPARTKDSLLSESEVVLMFLFLSMSKWMHNIVGQ